MLQFDAETTRKLDIAYTGGDVIRRRRATFDALDVLPGEVVVDIGCGNGLLTAELARATGPTGRVIGVDPSETMLDAARARCAGFPWTDLTEGTAEATGLEAALADKAASVQVFEYLSDIPAALREAHRILRSSGRLVISDIHFDCWAWHSDDPDRMQRMIDAWDHHFTERRVPALLPPMMRDAGFVVDRVAPVTICDHVLRPDGLANMMLLLMESFAASGGHVPAEEARAWADEQRALAAEGRFFFAITQFVTSATKA